MTEENKDSVIDKNKRKKFFILFIVIAAIIIFLAAGFGIGWIATTDYRTTLIVVGMRQVHLANYYSDEYSCIGLPLLLGGYQDKFAGFMGATNPRLYCYGITLEFYMIGDRPIIYNPRTFMFN